MFFCAQNVELKDACVYVPTLLTETLSADAIRFEWIMTSKFENKTSFHLNSYRVQTKNDIIPIECVGFDGASKSSRLNAIYFNILLADGVDALM